MARGSKCCPVYLTQSLPTYYAKMGGGNRPRRAHGLVGKFITHIYHSNACPETNEYASRMIGKVITRRSNYSAGNSQSFNEGMSKGNNENTGSSSSHGSRAGRATASIPIPAAPAGRETIGATTAAQLNHNVSRGYSESMEYVIEPGDFAQHFAQGRPGKRQYRNRRLV